MMRAAKQDDSEEDRNRDFLQYRARFMDRQREARYGVLPEDHELVRWTQQFLEERVAPGNPEDVKITICPNWREVAAGASPTGRIYLSAGLFNVVETEEELHFVLGHEYRHLKEKHFDKIFESRSDWGIRRLSEYRADLGSMKDMSKEDNPVGGILFLKKMRKADAQGDNPDIGHGRDIDRLLNLLWMTRLVDLGDLSPHTTSLPGMFESLRELKGQTTIEWLCSKDTKSFNERTWRAQAASVMEAVSSLELLNERWSTNVEQAHGFARGAYVPTLVQQDGELIDTLLKKVRAYVQMGTSLRTQSPQNYQHMTALVLAGTCGKREPDDKFFDSLSKRSDVDRFLDNCSADRFCDLGLAAVNSQAIRELMVSVATHGLSEGLFQRRGKLDVKDYLAFSQRAVECMNELDAAAPRRSQSTMKEFFTTGLYEFTPSNPKLQEYVRAFLPYLGPYGMYTSLEQMGEKYLENVKHLFENRPSIVIHEVSQPYKDIAKKEQEENEAFDAEIKQKRQEMSKSAVNTHTSTRAATPSSKQMGQMIESLKTRAAKAKEKKRKTVDEMWEEVEPRLKGMNLDLPAIVEEFHAYAAALEITPPQGLAAQRLLLEDKWADLSSLRQDLLSYTTMSLLGGTDDPKDWPRHIIAQRAVFANSLPDEFVTPLQEAVVEEAGHQNPFPTIPHALPYLRELHDALFDEATVRHAHPFLRKDEPIPIMDQSYYLFELMRLTLLQRELATAKEPELSTANGQELRTLLHDALLIEPRLHGAELTPQLNRFLRRATALQSWDMARREHAETLFYLSCFITNGAYASSLQNTTLRTLLEGDFKQGYDFLFSPIVQKNLRSVDVVTEFVEREARTHDQFAQLKEKLEDIMGWQEASPALGNLPFVELIAEELGRNAPMAVLGPFLRSSYDEIPLKKVLVAIRISDKEGMENAADTLYRTGITYRYALLRNLLTSKKGALTNTASRQKLFYLLQQHLLEEPQTEQDTRWYSHTTKLMKTFLVGADMEDSYFVLVPLLLDSMLIPPRKPARYKDVILDYTIDRHFPEGGDEAALLRPLVHQYIQGRGKAENLAKYVRWEKREDRSRPKQDIEAEFFQTVEEIKEEMNRVEERDAFSTMPDISVPTELERLIPLEHSDKNPKRSTLQFIVSAAKTLGAPGVRALQLLGQYVDIEKEYQDEFSQVYDAVRGQSKIAAYLLLEREWQGFKEQVASLEECLGGGSLMTVYRAQLADGTQEAVKILNPNASYHTEVSFGIITKLLKRIARQDPAYERALPLVEDIRQWIVQDIAFEGFLERDAEFYRQHHGFTLPGNQYRIKIPKSHGPENKYFKREEYIAGTNLTQREELMKEGHDLRQVVSLIAYNYLSQIEQGLVHSDVHPGNFRITSDKEVAILDRNYYLQLTAADKALLSTIVGSDDPEQKAIALRNYLAPRNPELPPGFTQGLQDTFTDYPATENGTENLSNVIRYIRASNVAMPLHMSLLSKNFHSLQSMARMAGFESLTETFTYGLSQTI